MSWIVGAASRMEKGFQRMSNYAGCKVGQGLVTLDEVLRRSGTGDFSENLIQEVFKSCNSTKLEVCICSGQSQALVVSRGDQSHTLTRY